MNCGGLLTESAYCPKCGCDVVVQKQAIVLSGLYYNRGLEKAEIRDLSGAISQLKRSLKFNKLNIPARNLLGLVYFETGEVVAALSEWVISKNIMPESNIASEYINRLQADSNKLDLINQTIKKYNQALFSCKQGNEDVAMIQLKKVLSQNPKLIKGYHLLGLLHIHAGEYEKARKVLKKAAKIDKTNTTTLRFLREVDEQTGTMTSLEPRWGNKERRRNQKEEKKKNLERPDYVIQPPTFRESSVVATLLNIGIGLVVGIAVVWFLFMPAKTKIIHSEANNRVTEYSRTMASQTVELNDAKEKITESENTVKTAKEQIAAANTQAKSYENLVKAFSAVQQSDFQAAANLMSEVDPTVLSVDAKDVYDSVLKNVQTTLFTKLYDEGAQAFDYERFDEAIEKLSKAREIKGDDYFTLNRLAHSYLKTGDTQKAKEVFQTIVDTFPGTKRATDAKAYITGDSNNLQENQVENTQPNPDGENVVGSTHEDTTTQENNPQEGASQGNMEEENN